MTTIETIKNRYSVRTYSNKPIAPVDKELLCTSMRAQQSGLFGSAIRFELIELAGHEQNQLKELVSYGMIKGAHSFITGAVKKGEHAMEDYGTASNESYLRTLAREERGRYVIRGRVLIQAI